jgi:hypothetical protein
MHYAFQDKDNLFVVIDIMQGGDLRYHFAKHRKFTEEQTSKLIIMTNVFRVLYWVHDAVFGVFAWEKHTS